MFANIEKEIAKKKLKDDLQSFDDFVVSFLEQNHFQISLNNKIAVGGAKGLILKIAQKIIYKIMQPIVEEQNAINNIFYLKIKQIENKIK